jgi:Ca-activated chloride channel homolog
MKYFLIIMLAFVSLNDPIKISKINRAKEEAKKAYEAGDFKKAANTYRYLIDSLEVKEDEVMLNLANALYQQKDTASASTTYQSLTASTKRSISSRANQQLGLMSNEKGKAEEALNYFKQAIKDDPANESARYNYEMLKKKLDEKKKQEEQQNKDKNKDQQNKDQQKDQQNKDQQNKDQQKKEQENKEQENKDQQKKDEQNKEQQNKDQQNKEQQNKEQQKKEEQQREQEQQQKEEQEKQEQQKKEMNLDPNKLKEMKISEEKARMILDAMRNQEKQYLQQLKRKSTKPRDRTKPDW